MSPDDAHTPLLLVDVDGVLSVFGAGVDRDDCVPALVEGIPHWLSRSAAAALARIAPAFECVWCTGWEDRADGHLPHLLGLPPGWRHLSFRDRPAVWIDDAHDERCREWAATRLGPTLLVTTDPVIGLTESDATRALEWSRRQAGP